MASSEIFTDRSLTICIGFRCNNACSICMLDGMRDELRPISYDYFVKMLKSARGKYDRIILSGSEVTLNDDLERYVRAAKENGFFRIQIQTNGRKFSSADYARQIVDSGANEFFVSLHGSSADVHDGITRVQGSFDETVQGIKNLSSLGTDVITNTVINRLNYGFLPDIARLVAGLGVKSLHMWFYWPMSDSDSKNLLVDVRDVKTKIIEAVQISETAGISLEVKKFPACILGRYSDIVKNDLSKTLIDGKYWKRFSGNAWSCIYSGCCKYKDTGCDGLSKAYISRFGDGKDFLNLIQDPDACKGE